MTRILLVLCVILLIVCPLAFAQNLGTGLYPFGSFDSRGFDTVNLGNLDTHFEIPIVNKPGRGLPFRYTFVYDGLVWSPSTTTGTPVWTPDSSWGFHGQLGEELTGYVTFNTKPVKTCTAGDNGRIPSGTLYYNYVYHDQFGKSHLFDYERTFCVGEGTTVAGSGATFDGSGYTFNGASVGFHGTVINAPVKPTSIGTANGTIVDTNGNTITNNGNGTFTDTLGVSALTIGGAGTPASPLTFSYPVTLQANSTTSAAATIAYKAYTVQTNFQCSVIESGAISANLIDHIILADGSTYSFTYEGTPGVSGAVTGRLASVALPTGGTISYTYTGGCNGSGMNADGTVGSLTRTTNDGTRTYSRSPINANATSTKVQDEKNNQSVYQFTISGGLFYETHRQIYQGSASGTPLLDLYTCYNGAAPPCDGAAMAQPITQTNSLTSYNGGSQLGVINSYDAAGMLTDSQQKNGSTVLQSTEYSYNLREEVATFGQFDGNHTAYAFTYYGFDETTPTATSGIPSHVGVTGTRGNVTSAHVSIGGPYLTTTTAYYDTGVPISVTTPDGTTSYGYDATQTFATSTTLPTPSSGVQLATTASFDSQSGAQLSSTGLNSGQTTQYTRYDPLLRPVVVSLPDGGNVEYNYQGTNQIGVLQPMSNGQIMDTETQLDGYSRKSRVAVANGQPSNPWYQTDYCYDATGLLQFQSSQYQGNGWATPKQCSGNGTSYTYDAMGRMLTSSNSDGTTTYQYNGRAVKITDMNNVQRITQYDLQGRLSGVCEISSNNSMPGSGAASSCAMDIAGTGFSTSYTYNLATRTTTVSQGGQVRTFVVDGIGRTTSLTEPERGQTTYSYAYNASGLQVVRTRPRANQTSSGVTTTTTTQYDSVGRPIGVVYNDGLTPNKAFWFDVITGWGHPQTYIAGQLTTAVVSGTASATSSFSYDAMGRTTSVQSCEPSTCGHSNLSRPGRSLSYDIAGNLISSSDGASGTISYGRSRSGEITSITNQTYTDIYNTPNLVSNVINGPYGPVSYSMGNGLSVNKTFDSLGRVTGSFLCQGSLAVSCAGGSQVYGFTAHQTGVRLTNTCDTVVSQCLNYSYDEFDRLTAQSGPTSFSYVYDRWGNRTSQTVTQGGPAPSPSYSFNTSNNQIQTPQGFTYDAAGNLINDTAHTYTYDAEGNLLTVDGGSTATYVYDALNRRVRQQTASGTYEYLYDPAGRRTSRWNVSNNSGDEGRIYWDRNQIAFRSLDGTTYFDSQDWLGTERMRTNYAGAKAMSYSSLAWGDGYTPITIQSGGTPDQDTLHYAQLDHDSESGTEHAQFRQLSSTQGRWMSPDPYDGSYDATNPQSLNRYSYVLNNPLRLIDPLGLDYTSCSTYTWSTSDGGGGGGGGADSGNPDDPTQNADARRGFGVHPNDSGTDTSCFTIVTGSPGSSGGGSLGGINKKPNPPYKGPYAPNNPPQVPHTCQQNRILNAVPGSTLTNPNDTVGTSVGGHSQFGINVTTDQLSAAGFTPFNPFGHADGYHNGNVFFQVHDNGAGGIVTQGHIDVFNPATGLFGFLGHSIVDVGIGTLLQHLLPHSHGLLDPGC